MKIIVSFSGGKDSQACLIKAVNDYGKDNVTAIFCDTDWEHPVTYQHIQYVVKKLGVNLITLKNEKIGSFQNLCKQMKCFPVATRRACTSTLKIKPMIDWVIGQDDSLIIIQGIRAGESKSRSKMDIECSFFKGYFDGTGVQYNKTKVLEWCKTHDASVLRPIFKWSAQDVIDYILKNGQKPNPLYSKGASRVGCFPCVMSRLSDIRILAKDKEMKDRLINLEKEVNIRRTKKYAGFFTKGTIPERFCIKNGDGCPTAEEVINYVTRNDDVPDMFEPEGGYSCMSLFHGLCE
jgi:3'-phosphoadenosine 5'-phosphosulfate sulfotransferase (PAPS reductase)/FAD synthetase